MEVRLVSSIPCVTNLLLRGREHAIHDCQGQPHGQQYRGSQCLSVDNTRSPPSAYQSQSGKTVTLSYQETRSGPDGTAVLFGSLPIPGSGNKILATDASFGGVILTVDDGKKAFLSASQAISNQTAMCWLTILDLTSTAFVTDMAKNRIAEMSLKDASI